VHGITGHNFETRHPSDDSDQVWFPLVKYFQRRDLKKVSHQKQELPVAAMFVNGSGRNEIRFAK
jgi:hypothetical protein